MELSGITDFRNLKYFAYLLAITFVVYFINTLFIFFIKLTLVDYSPSPLHNTSMPEEKRGQARPFLHYKPILERNLFSVVVDEDEAISSESLLAKIDQLALTSMNFTLIGTIINEHRSSWAIIKDNQTNHQDKYIVGSTISGANVVMILRNKIVLNIDGKDELLVMGIEKIKAEKSDKEASGQDNSKGSVATYNLDRNFIKNSINNVAQIMSQVRVKPFFKNGKPAGFKISRIKDGSLFKTMGFKDNDIIQSVNGHKIASAKDIMGLYNTLKDSHLFSISIIRKDQTKTLNFKVR